MPLLQPVPDLHDVEVPRPLRIDRSARSSLLSSSSASPSPSPSPAAQQHRSSLGVSGYIQPPRPSLPSRAQQTPDHRDVEVPNRLCIQRPAVSTPLSSPLPSSQQPRRLEVSIPVRPRLTPPKAQPVDSAHRKSDQKTSLIPTLRIKRRLTYHTTTEPRTPSTPLGHHVSIATGNTPCTQTSSLSSSSEPHSPFPADKKIQTTPTTFPTPLTTTLASPQTSTPITPPSTRRHTALTRSLTTKLKKPFAALNFFGKKQETEAERKERERAQKREDWYSCAMAMSTRGAFGPGFEEGVRRALGSVLEENGYMGRRGDTPVGERRDGGGEVVDEAMRNWAILEARLALLNLEPNRTGEGI